MWSKYMVALTVFVLPIKVYSLDTDLGDMDLYKIVWKGPMTSQEPSYIDEDNVIDISTATKDRYRCIVPNDNVYFNTAARNSSSSNDDKSPIRALEPLLRGNFCSHNFELFWVYELCHGKFLRQYHEEKNKFKTKVTQEYFLGKLTPQQITTQIEEYERNEAQLKRSGQYRLPTVLVDGRYLPYIMVNMTDGTKCDLTGTDRVTRVIYTCNEVFKNELYSIKEISTCEYEAVVLTPYICEHKDFKIEASTQQEISCFSIGNAPRRPEKALEMNESEETANKRRSVAYFSGGTLIIDADLILA